MKKLFGIFLLLILILSIPVYAGITNGSGTGISLTPGSGGSATFPTGTTGQYLYYASGGTTLTPISPVTVSGDVSVNTSGVATVSQIQGVAVGTPTGTGAVVLGTAPTIATPTITDAIQNSNLTSTGTLTATSNTTLANITGLTYTGTASGTYNFHIHLTGVANASGGLKVAFGGTGTATSFTSTCWNWNGTTINAVTTITSLASSMTAQTAAYTDLICDGAIVVNAGGTFILQAAQNASFGTSTTVLLNSSMTFSRTN